METNIDIIPLPKEQWKGTTIPLVTRSDSYYDVEIKPLDKEGCTVNIVEEDAVESFIERVGRKYLETIGYEASFYVVTAGDGAHRVD